MRGYSASMHLINILATEHKLKLLLPQSQFIWLTSFVVSPKKNDKFIYLETI